MQSLAAEDLKPRLTANAAGDLFVEITIGKHIVSEKLPSMDSPAEAHAYIDKMVPEMVKRYYRNNRNRRKRGV